jgi:hypothetical protein
MRQPNLGRARSLGLAPNARLSRPSLLAQRWAVEASVIVITRTSHYESFTVSGTGYILNGRLATRLMKVVDIITRTSHYESFTMSGTGFNDINASVIA